MRRQRKSRVRSAIIKGLTPFGRGFDGTLGADATFARATTATYIDATGDMQLAASGEARFQSDIGYFGEKASTNKCTNYNANPTSGAFAPTSIATFNTNTTNMIASDSGSGALFGVVTDAAELTSAGLDGVVGLVFKIDNSGGSGNGIISIGGLTGNTNVHSMSIQARVSAGTGQFVFIGEGSSTNFINTSYAKLTHENKTPSGVGNQLQVKATTGAVVYFILNQLEESAFVTSEIITEGASTPRNKDDLSYPTTFIPVNDCVFSFDWTPTVDVSGTVILFGMGIASDFISIWHDSVNLRFSKTITSINYDAATPLTYVADTTYKIKGRLSSIDGIHIWLDDVIGGTSNSNITDFIVGGTLNIGSHYNLTAQQTGGIKNFIVYQGNYTDAEVVAL